MPAVSVPSGDLSRIPGDRGRALRGIEIANRKPSQYGYMERVAMIGEGRYRVPSYSTEGVRYFVDLDTEYCECRDHQHGHTCLHMIAGMVKAARRAAALSLPVRCDGCGQTTTLGDTREVSPEDLEFLLGNFEGDRICNSCAGVKEVVA